MTNPIDVSKVTVPDGYKLVPLSDVVFPPGTIVLPSPGSVTLPPTVNGSSSPRIYYPQPHAAEVSVVTPPATPSVFWMLTHSRKIDILVTDAVFAIVTLLATRYLSPTDTTLVAAIVAALQLPVKAVIDAIATEDAARLAAGLDA